MDVTNYRPLKTRTNDGLGGSRKHPSDMKKGDHGLMNRTNKGTRAKATLKSIRENDKKTSNVEVFSDLIDASTLDRYKDWGARRCFDTTQTRFGELPSNIDDIYEGDNDNEQMLVPYVDQIFEYMYQIETEYVLKPEYLTKGITSKFRTILIDWMIAVHFKFRQQADTLYLAVDLLDRFLGIKEIIVPKEELQMIGVTCLFIASKFEEIYPPEASDFTYMADGACGEKDLYGMEMLLLDKLDFDLTKPLQCKFLRRYSKAANSDNMQYFLAKFILEVSLCFEQFSAVPASQIAAASQYLAMALLPYGETDRRKVEPKAKVWDSNLQYYSTYKLSQFQIVARNLLKCLYPDNLNRMKSLKKKYSAESFMKIAVHSCMKEEYLNKLEHLLDNTFGEMTVSSITQKKVSGQSSLSSRHVKAILPSSKIETVTTRRHMATRKTPVQRMDTD